MHVWGQSSGPRFRAVCGQVVSAERQVWKVRSRWLLGRLPRGGRRVHTGSYPRHPVAWAFSEACPGERCECLHPDTLPRPSSPPCASPHGPPGVCAAVHACSVLSLGLDHGLCVWEPQLRLHGADPTSGFCRTGHRAGGKSAPSQTPSPSWTFCCALWPVRHVAVATRRRAFPLYLGNYVSKTLFPQPAHVLAEGKPLQLCSEFRSGTC